MWVRVPGACAPEFMVSSLETLKRAPNKPIIAGSPSVIWFQSPGPSIGPSSISNVELPAFSLVAPLKPLNNPPVSNEATASPVGPKGQKLCFFYGSFLVGTYCSERHALLLSITPGRSIACSEDVGVV